MLLIWDTIQNLKISKNKFIINHVICIIPAIIYAACSVIYPNFIGQIIDKGIAVGNISQAIFYSVLMIVVGLITVISEYSENVLYDKFYLELSSEIKNQIFKIILNASNQFISTAKAGELFTSINNDINNIVMLITRSLPNVITNTLIFIGASVYILFYYKVFGLIIICIGLFYVVYQKKIGQKMQDASEKTRSAVGNEASFCTESLSNLESIQMSGYVDLVYSKYEAFNKDSKVQCKNHDAILYKSYSSSFLIDMFIMIFILIIGAFEIQNNGIEVGILFSLILYAQKIISPMRMLARLYVEIKDSYPILQKTNNLVKNIWIEEETTKLLKIDINHIKFENVYFSYNERYVLKNLNLEINANDIIGVTGSNGKGKTTLLRIISKMCFPNKGNIIINNEWNIQDIDIESLHSQISILTQKIYIGSGTLREVVNPFHKSITDGEIIDLLHSLNLDLRKFNNSLEFNISENANNISGGERQKIALARLIIEDKKWIILDEPTSAMDTESENIICQYLKQFLSNRTALIITHRFAILDICTKTINFDKMKG